MHRPPTGSNPNPEPFHITAKPAGPICNLDCDYCFYLEKEKLYPQARTWRLEGDALESFISQYIAAQPTPVVHFTWQGGEPTLAGVEYFREVLRLQQRYAQGRRIENALQTNGVLLDEEWCGFLAQHHFLVGISIDGPEHLHDRYRLGKNRRGTFNAVMRGMELLKEHGVDFNTLTVVHRENAAHALDVYRFLRESGSGYMQFLPVVERITTTPSPDGLTLALPDEEARVSDWSVEPEQYGRFLCDVFDEWVRHDVARIFVQIFDVTLENWLGMTPSLCVFRENCGSALAIEHNGDVYSCDHYVYPRYRLGNVAVQNLGEMVASAEQVAFGRAKSELPQYCQQCDVKFACRGECPKHRFAVTPDGEPGLNYLCAAYQMFFRHVGPYMDYMVSELNQQRPPASVMEFARRRPAH